LTTLSKELEKIGFQGFLNVFVESSFFTMITAESDLIYSINRRFFDSPVSTLNRPRRGRFDPFWASERSNT
jgi:hypothetical protein